MSLRMTEDEYAALLSRRKAGKDARSAQPNSTPEAKRTKYGNRRTECDGMLFDSQHEVEVYKRLTLETKAGEHIQLFRQVAYKMPGSVKYIADFVTLEKDGRYTVWDAKSTATARDKVYRIKKRLMYECLGLEIKEV